jgi:dihydroorotate dehydrogenase (NAD+) catalytic subunit
MGQTVSLCGMEIDNPVIPASGAFGYGMDYLDFFDVNEVGTFCTKGTTLHPHKGNPLPRIAEYNGGMLNCVGLENPGVDAVVNDYLPRLKTIYKKKIIANVCGFSIDDYVKTSERFDKEDMVGLIELNISCPNVHAGGAAFGMDPSTAKNVLKEVKKVCKKPIFVKCTPQCPDLVLMCKTLEDSGADGLVLLNTWLGMRLDIRTGKPILSNTTGGVSGPGIFPLTLYKIYEVYPQVNIPIIGCGGISSGGDIIEMMSAGASAVEIGTELLCDPSSFTRIRNELSRLMDTYKISELSDIIGRGAI